MNYLPLQVKSIDRHFHRPMLCIWTRFSQLRPRRFGDAIKSYTELANLSPEEGSVYVDFGYAYENDGKIEKALRTI